MKPFILIAEDNQTIADVYVDTFKSMGLMAHVIRDGKQVVEYFERRSAKIPALLMLDVNLPNVSGLYILKYLRKKHDLPHMKIVMATANKLAIAAPEMALADAVLEKPVMYDTLLDLVDELVGFHG